MIIGKVTGTIYSTINHKYYDGKKLKGIRKPISDKVRWM